MKTAAAFRMAELREARRIAALNPVEQYVEAAWAAYQLDPESATCERGHIGCAPVLNGTCTDALLEARAEREEAA